MASSLTGMPPLRGTSGGGLGRGLGSLAPLGRPSLSSLSSSGLDSISPSLSPSQSHHSLNKPKLGQLPASASTASSSSSATAAAARLGGLTRNTAGASYADAGLPRVQPLKFAVRFSPPTLALEYRDRKYPTRMRSRVHEFVLPELFDAAALQIDITQLNSKNALESLARRLASLFPIYLSPNSVSPAQLTRLIKKALSRPDAAAASTTTHAHVHPAMIHRGPGSGASSAANSYSHSMIEDELEVSAASASASHLYEPIPAPAAAPARSTESAMSFIPGNDPSEAEDLNHVSQAELERKKAEMNKGFEQTLLRPGDAGYIYDKQVEFQPTEESEWD